MQVNNTDWKSKELELLASIRPFCSCKEISKVFSLLGYNRTFKSIEHKSSRLGLRFIELGYPDTISSFEKEVKEAVDTVVNYRLCSGWKTLPPIISPTEKAKITKERNEDIRDLYTELQELREETPRINSIIGSEHIYMSTKETLCICLSDFHIGKKITNEEKQEIYNTEIAAERIRELGNKVSGILVGNKNTIDEVIILLIGDLVDGEGIYPGQAYNSESTVLYQVKAAVKAIWEFIQYIKEICPRIRIITCRGNHGRTDNSQDANWDNIIYQQLELLADWEKEGSIHIKNLYEKTNTFHCKGWKGLIRHYAPVQADTAAAIAKYAGWYSQTKWDFMNFGHWHHAGIFTWNTHPIIRNGSLCGGDDYAEEFGSFDYPTQVIYTVSEEEVLRYAYPVVLK